MTFKEKIEKYENRIAIVFIILFLLLVYIVQKSREDKRLKNPIFKCAIINKVQTLRRGKRYVYYVFYIENEHFERYERLGRNELLDCTEDNPWCVGKVYKVIYEEGNYKNSELLLNDSCDDLIEKDTAIKWLLDIEYYKPDGKFWKDQHKDNED